MFHATHSAPILTAGLLGILLPAVVEAGAKPNCRDLTFGGAAGAASNDKVTLRMVDSGGNRVDDSCQLQVQNNESARAFAARLVGAWGSGTGTACVEPVPLPKKTCGNGILGKSCNHKFKFKPDKTTLDPDDGLILVRICCFDSAGCKGTKLVATPASAQTKVDPAVSFSPSVPPPVGITVTPVALDPIGLTQRPFAALQTCRGALGLALAKLAVSASETLAACHRDQMQGVLPPTIDCNALSGASDPGQGAAPLAAAVRTVATGICAQGGQPPSNVGYDDAACPCPCQAIAPHVCSAGRIGTPCSADPDCDLVPGAGDGRCAIPGWGLAADCAICLAETGVSKGIAATYGVPGPGPGVPPIVEACADAAGTGLTDLVRVEVAETGNCQSAADAGKLGLPPSSTCRDADPKHRRAAAEAKIAQSIASACAAGLPPSGCIGTADPAGCVITQARTAAGAVSGAAFPEIRPPVTCSPGGAFLDAVLD